MYRTSLLGMIGSWALVLAAPAQAVVLDFPLINGCSNSADGAGPMISCTDGTYIHQGAADTSAVDFQYADMNAADPDTLLPNTLLWWSGGYNNLPSAVWASGDDTSSHARITLAALPGYTVRLNGFDLGAWLNSSMDTQLHVYELGGGAELINGTVTAGLQPDNVATHFSFADAVSQRGWVIEWRDSAYAVGLANLSFEGTVTAVPEPQSWLMLAAGMALLGWRRRQPR